MALRPTGGIISSCGIFRIKNRRGQEPSGRVWSISDVLHALLFYNLAVCCADKAERVIMILEVFTLKK